MTTERLIKGNDPVNRRRPPRTSGRGGPQDVNRPQTFAQRILGDLGNNTASQARSERQSFIDRVMSGVTRENFPDLFAEATTGFTNRARPTDRSAFQRFLTSGGDARIRDGWRVHPDDPSVQALMDLPRQDWEEALRPIFPQHPEYVRDTLVDIEQIYQAQRKPDFLKALGAGAKRAPKTLLSEGLSLLEGGLSLLEAEAEHISRPAAGAFLGQAMTFPSIVQSWMGKDFSETVTGQLLTEGPRAAFEAAPGALQFAGEELFRPSNAFGLGILSKARIPVLGALDNAAAIAGDATVKALATPLALAFRKIAQPALQKSQSVLFPVIGRGHDIIARNLPQGAAVPPPPSNDEIIKRVRSPRNSANLYNSIADKLKGIGYGDFRPAVAVIDLIDPRILAEGPMKEATLIRAAVLDHGDNVAVTALDRIHLLGDESSVLAMDDIIENVLRPDGTEGRATVKTFNGVTPKEEGFSRAWGEILEWGETRYNLTPGVKRYRDTAIKVLDEVNALLKKEGIDFAELGMEEGRHYYPRWVEAIADLELKRGTVRGGSMIGVKQNFQKARWYDEMVEGMRNGVSYKGPTASIDAYIKASFKAIADERFARIAKPFGVSDSSLVGQPIKQAVVDTASSSKVINGAPQVVNRLVRGERLPRHTLEHIKRWWPEIGAEIEAIAGRSQVMRRGLVQSVRQLSGNIDALSRDLTSGAVRSTREIADAMQATIRQIEKSALSEVDAVTTKMTGEQRIWAEAILDAGKLTGDDLIKLEQGLRRGQIKTVADLTSTFKGKVTKADVRRYLRAAGWGDVTQERLVIRQMMQDLKAATRLSQSAASEGARNVQKAVMTLVKAERGVRSGTIKDMRKVRALVKEAKDLIVENTRAIRKTAAELGRPFQRSLKGETKELLEKIGVAQDQATKTWGESRAAFTSAKQGVNAGLEGAGRERVNSNAFGTANIFPKVMAKDIRKLLNDEAEGWVKTTADVSSAAVSLRATLDVSAPFIQGLVFYSQNPAAWAKAAYIHMTALFDPSVVRAFRVGEQEVIGRMHRDAGVIFSSNDFYESANSGLLAKAPVVGAVLRRFGISFDTFGDIVRVEMFKAHEQAALKKGGTAISELGSFVNKASGVVSSRGMGIGANQRAAERGWLLFAPRFTRAYLGLMADVARGGYSGELARNALGRLMFVGAATYTAVSLALNQDPKKTLSGLNPLSANFLSVEVGGDVVGVGGIFRSLAKQTSRAIEQAIERPGEFFSMDNATLRFWRGRISPIGGLAWNLTDGRNYIGEPVRGWGNLGNLAANNLLPFAVAGRLTEHPRAGWATLPGELAGLNAHALNPWEQAHRIRDLYGQAVFRKDYDDLNTVERLHVNAFDEVKERVEFARSTREERGRNISQRIAIFSRRRNELMTTRLDDLNRFEDQVRDGTKSRSWFLGKRGEVYDGYFRALEGLDNPFDELDEDDEDTPQLDLAVDRYFEIADTNQYEDENGDVDWTAQDKAVARYLQTLDQDTINDINTVRNWNKTDLELEWEVAKGHLRPYDEAWRQVVGDSPFYTELYERWQLLDRRDNRAEARRLEDQNPIITEINRRVRQLKQMMRMRDPQLDRAIVEWRDGVPIFQQAGNVRRVRATA